jgi:hypothetical protein
LGSEKGYSYAGNWLEWHHKWETGVSLGPLEERLYVNILRIAGNAQLKEPDNPEYHPMGILQSITSIEVQKSPIQWISAFLDGNEEVWGEIHYGIPDPRPLPDISIEVRPVKGYPIFGSVKGIRWVFLNLNKTQAKIIAKSLNDNHTLTSVILGGNIDLPASVWSHSGMWWIRTYWKNPAEVEPSAQQWACYEKIATSLLSAPLLE